MTGTGRWHGEAGAVPIATRLSEEKSPDTAALMDYPAAAGSASGRCPPRAVGPFRQVNAVHPA
jgi:hypothetical protein